MAIEVRIIDPETVPPRGARRSGRRTGRWIDDWDPENPAYWAAGGKQVARRNLVFSILGEHLGFSVWLMWSAAAATLSKVGFAFTPQQLFWLVALPNLVGSLLRLPYTFAVPRFGGRNWAVLSAGLLVVPTLLFAWAVQDPTTPYWMFLLIAATAGVGGGNFASSMASINFFYPAHLKGTALGLNAAGGNLGVAVIQFFFPIIVGGTGAFGLVKASEAGLMLPRAGFLYAALAVAAAVCAWLFMDNLAVASSRPRQQLSALRHGHTWVMSFLYIGTFGSFIGFSAAMPLLIKINFFNQPVPSIPGIGINFAFYGFLGALVGSLVRPLGGMVADRLGGAVVTLASFLGMILGVVLVLVSLSALTPVPRPAPGAAPPDPATFTYPDAVRDAVAANEHVFPWFLAAFLIVFAASGLGNGSTYRMIPSIFRAKAAAVAPLGTPERADAEVRATRESSAVIGIAGAIGAIGGFLIPITFSAPWVTDPVAATRQAFVIFLGFYVVCLAVTWFCYLRPRAEMARAGV
ncbi:MFS transporter [Nocardioides sp.]|uniref:MFS transporter n=1 Tax=Nocardioides sp. TaxID=35761 RepID=UPI0035148E52